MLKKKSLNAEQIMNLACLSFGAVQTLTLGLFPALSNSLDASLSSLILIYGLGIVVFLGATKFWGERIGTLGFSSTLVVGVLGLVTSQCLMILALQNSFSSGFLFYMASRAIYSLLASSLIPLGQALRLREKSASKAQKLLDHTLSLHVGRVVGFALFFLTGGKLVYSLIAVSVLAGGVFPLILFKKEGNLFFSQEPSSASRFDSLFVLPLTFCLIVSSIHTGLSKLIVELVPNPALQTDFLYKTLLFGTLFVVFCQLVMRKFELFHQRDLSVFGAAALFMASIGFPFISSTFQLGLFIALFGLSAAVTPISYMKKIFEQFEGFGRSQISAELNFYQVLGNALGALLTGLMISRSPQWGWSLAIASGIFLLMTLSEKWGRRIQYEY